MVNGFRTGYRGGTPGWERGPHTPFLPNVLSKVATAIAEGLNREPSRRMSGFVNLFRIGERFYPYSVKMNTEIIGRTSFQLACSDSSFQSNQPWIRSGVQGTLLSGDTIPIPHTPPE
jgi:hypothetical protein